MSTIEIPSSIYESDKNCAEFILDINERLSKLSALEKALKEAKEVANNVMLDRLAATGQKHFAFEGLGTFKKTVSTKVSFPPAEKGGKEAAVAWLIECLARGVITPAQLLDVQQSRLSVDPVLYIEGTVRNYNLQQKLNGSDDLLPESPFHHFEQVMLVSPRTRKA